MPITSVKDAIAVAKGYINEVFLDEGVSNLGLEETVYDEGQDRWAITVGFSRPWNAPQTRAQDALAGLGVLRPLERSFKVVTVSRDGSVVSMQDRPRVTAAQ